MTVKSRYLAMIRAGAKTTTIRLTCSIRRGQVFSFTDYRTSCQVVCTGLKHLRVHELTDAHAVDDGFRDVPELLAALRAHYATLTPDTRVWVVRFALKDSDQSALALT